MNLSVSRAQQDFDREHSSEMQGLPIIYAPANMGSANDMERKQDDAEVESDEFKDDEFDASNKGHKYASGASAPGFIAPRFALTGSGLYMPSQFGSLRSTLGGSAPYALGASLRA